MAGQVAASGAAANPGRAGPASLPGGGGRGPAVAVGPEAPELVGAAHGVGGRGPANPRLDVRVDLGIGEGIALAGVAGRVREDHADDVTAGVDHRSAGIAGVNVGLQHVDLARDLGLAVDVATDRFYSSSYGRGADDLVATARVPDGRPDRAARGVGPGQRRKVEAGDMED